MIGISRCPYRISLLGGGSDLDWFVNQNDYGISLGYSLNQYSYTVVKKLSNLSRKGRLNYSTREDYRDVENIAHPLIKEVLKYFKVPFFIEMASFGFATRGSGLGGSSSFLISLITSLAKILEINLSNSEIARIACEIEINQLQKPIGRQDQYISSAGGISCFKYEKNKVPSKYQLSKYQILVLDNIINNLYLIPSRINRSADKVLKNLKNSESSNNDLLEIRTIAETFINSTLTNKLSLSNLFNDCVKASWDIKKNMSGVISGNLINQYECLQKLPIHWIRMLGAGSGGYFLIYPTVEPHEIEKLLIKAGINDFTKATISPNGAELLHSS